jgi:hypothetical protein
LDNFSNNPVTYFLNSNLFYSLDINQEKKVNINVSPLQFEREENKILQYGQEDTNTVTYKIENVREYTDSIDTS